MRGLLTATGTRVSSPRRFIRNVSKEQVALAAGIFGGAVLALSFLLRSSFRQVGVEPGSIVLLAILVVPALTCGRDPFHPARLIAVLLGLGFVIGPVVHALSGFYALPGGAARQHANLDRATWMLVPGAALAMIAMRAVLGEAWGSTLGPIDSRPIRTRSLYAAAAVAFAGLIALFGYLVLLGQRGLLLQHQSASYAVQPGEGHKAYLNLFAPTALGAFFIFVAAGFERRSRMLILLASVSTLLGSALLALPGSRANFLYGVVPLLLIYAYYRRPPRLRAAIVILAVIVASLLYGAALRNPETRSMLIKEPGRTLLDITPTSRDVEASFLVDVAHTESLIGAIDAYPSTSPFMGGESFAFGATGPVGSKFARVIGLRPEPPAGVTLTASAYQDDPSTFGSGLTATLPGELYANGGAIGLVIGLAGFGALVGWIRKRTIRSSARGKIVLYTTATTTLFAVFADYSGQLYRGGAVFLGASAALVAADRLDFPLLRTATAASAVAVSAAACLSVRRLAGPPPSAILESMVPVYVVIAAVAAYVAIRVFRTKNGISMESLYGNRRRRTTSEAS
jgi:hypothetical protein